MNQLKEVFIFFPFLAIETIIFINIFIIAVKKRKFSEFFSIFSLISILFIFLFYKKNSLNLKFKEFFLFDNLYFFYSILSLTLIIFLFLDCKIFFKSEKKNLNNLEEIYILFFISLISSMIVSSSNGMITLYIGIEIFSITSFGIVSFIEKNKYTKESITKYILYSVVSSAILLFGIALVYASIGKFSFSSIQENIFLINKEKLENTIFLVGLSFSLVGISGKLSLFPFHFWTADTYQGISNISSIFISTIGKVILFSGISKFLLKTSILEIEYIYYLIYILVVLSIFFGNFIGFFQKRLTRMIGCSSITTTGIILSPYLIKKGILEENQAIKLSISYLLGYIITILGIFLFIQIIEKIKEKDEKEIGIDKIFSYEGYLHNFPILRFSFLVFLLSFCGLPITIGFITKFFILFSFIKNNFFIIPIFILVSSFLGILYFLKITKILYSNKKIHSLIVKKNSKILIYKFFMFFYSIVIVIFGLHPKLIEDIINLF
ncbi:NADH-quinone oxidoreductase subunit N [bacterium endosymbiont of Pedicinus badii]|uniref:NADH-quinone oxidoreductase subunit N n=1 Tax=bacterium endosymbiont of Pedicinus badii TaxID=1719126 RepID=UPI0009BBA284|nr:proton-conducting transporter membrane subunit [bacterium endosymbiont of Pedicinus badii]OQM34445.1 hypothetical protein AOQ89_00970 [bacterium endosymbiont of Pedicinus badii]